MSNEITVMQQTSIVDSFNFEQMTKRVSQIQQFQSLVHKSLKKGIDYDTIPGCKNPCILKPGAEKVVTLLGLTSEINIEEKVEDFEKGFFHYLIKCSLFSNGVLICNGFGSANSKEAKWSSKWVTEKQLPEGLDKKLLEKRKANGKWGEYTQYKVEQDGNSLANTILKMAKKRALVDASLMVGNLSELFTQDMEDTIDLTPPASEQPPSNNQTNDSLNKTEIETLINQAADEEALKAIFPSINSDSISNNDRKELMKTYNTKKSEFNSDTNNAFNSQNKTVRALEAKLGWNDAQHKLKIQKMFGENIKSSKDLTFEQMNDFIEQLQLEVDTTT